MVNPQAIFGVYGGTLGQIEGDDIITGRFKSTDTNHDNLIIKNIRKINGSDWNSASVRINRLVDSTNMGYLEFGSHNNDLITFGKSETEYMRINNNGYVGIGTTSPTAELEVNGDIVSLTGKLDTTKGDNSWIFPTLGNGWSNYATATPARYMKDSMRFVHLGGFVNQGTLNSCAFTLPVSYRPLFHIYAPSAKYNLVYSGGMVYITENGCVAPYESHAIHGLDSITFYAGN